MNLPAVPEIRQLVDRARIYQVEANGRLVNLGEVLAALYRVEAAARVMSAGAPRYRRDQATIALPMLFLHLGELRDALDGLVSAESGKGA